MKNFFIRPWAGKTTLERPVFLPVILGTNRKGRLAAHAAHYVLGFLKRRVDATTELIDVADFDFPKDDYGTSTKGLFPAYVDTASRADGFVIVSPEYNHGYSGRLKTLLDVLLPEYNRKAAGIVSVSSGPWGGVRMIENLVPVLRELGLVVSGADLQFPLSGDAFLASGEPRDPNYRERTERFLNELVWLAKALRWGRGTLQ